MDNKVNVLDLLDACVSRLMKLVETEQDSDKVVRILTAALNLILPHYYLDLEDDLSDEEEVGDDE